MLKRILVLLQVLAIPGFAVITEAPKGVGATFYSSRDRIMVLLDPMPGGVASATSFRCGGREITPPFPLTKSGVYEYPSFKLVYELPGWPAAEVMNCGFNGDDLRYILREVWTPPAPDGSIVPASPGSAVFPHGFALHDQGSLVSYLRPEIIWRKYTDLECFVLMIPSPPHYDYDFDEFAQILYIETVARGPGLFGGNPKWYHEEYTIDLRTGKILSVRIVDWIERTLWIVCGLIAGGLTWWIVRSRRKRAPAQATQ